MSISNIIVDLLLRHDCVIVPNFGGFVGQAISATIDHKKGIINPPSKKILFNTLLKTNDGLLSTKLANAKAISYQKASEMIDKQVEIWKIQLQNKQQISIDKLGILFLDENDKIGFLQDNTFNLLMASYGMKAFKIMKPTAIVTNTDIYNKNLPTSSAIKLISTEINENNEKQIQNIQNIQNKDVLPINIVASNNKIWKHMLAGCVVPLLFYSFWIPLKTDILESKIISFNDLNPFYKQAEATYKPIKIQNAPKISQQDKENISLNEELKLIQTTERTYSYKLTQDTYILVNIESINDKTQQTTKNIATNTDKKFHFIVGCFAKQENAEKLIEKLTKEGFNSYIKDKKGKLYRVAAGASDSIEEINELAHKITKLGLTQGWILKH